MDAFKKVVKNLDEILISAALAAVCLVLIAQVFFRYILNTPLVWSEELARYLFIWLTMLGLGYNVRTDNDISMTLIHSKMPPAVQLALDSLTDLLGIAVYGGLIPSALAYFQSQRGILSSAMKLPMGFLAVSVPIGFALVAVRLAVRLVRRFWRPARGGEGTA